ncbi:MAG: bifunctional oligoribonuclease/PAP phosphatase NrnA [Anaerolineae bacterium]|nr:bifunctional oligoribonuclease/PAP phosphatase NrnA [Anaerolineae bacterium]NIN99386.1 bifunctional oligoribonuclease/PAP phosphatase NrnA [Anaerolineae bacterium]NIQ82251.1 bifunctional oligoribonuclease/PAP phosphatase NrnA [Anaerolineae bacterium]
MSEQLRKLIDCAQRIFLIAHVDPDGDTIGSTLALARVLRKMGKECSVACDDLVPEALLFLPGTEAFGTPQITGEDLIITVDVSDPDRLGNAYQHVPSLDTTTVNIDHHVTNPMFATVNLVRTEAAATAEIIFDLLLDWEIRVDALLATYLLTGIVTDTRSFSTSSTTPRTLEISAQLMKAGASLIEINENYFRQRRLATLRLWGRMLDEMQMDGHLVWSFNTLDMKTECEASSDDGDGIVNLLATARDAKAAIVFKEMKNGQIDVSIRSRPGVDISPIAVHFGGGGHPQAAGALVEGDLDQVARDVLSKAKEVLDSNA